MKRRLFTILSVLSLLLLVAVAIFWMFEPGQFYYSSQFFGPNEFSAVIWNGTLVLFLHGDLTREVPFGVNVPLWTISLCTAVLPAIWLRDQFRTRRRLIAERRGFEVTPQNRERRT